MRTTTNTSIATAVPAASAPPASQLPVTVDTKGRVRTSREQRRRILDEFERSGVSAVEFARRSGLKSSTLAGWRHRHRRSKRSGPVRSECAVHLGGNRAGAAGANSRTLEVADGVG